MNPFALVFEPDETIKGIFPHSGIQPSIPEPPFGVRYQSIYFWKSQLFGFLGCIRAVLEPSHPTSF